MAQTHAYPGAVSGTRLRALVLSEAAGTPLVSVSPERAGVPQPLVETTPLVVPAELGQALQGIRAFVARVSGLVPGEPYSLMTPDDLLRFSTPADEAPLKVAIASCFYDGYRGDAKYLAGLRRPHLADCAFKILLGDNLYLDTYDLDFDEPWKDVAAHYLRHWWHLDYRRVLQASPTLTTWDDHEFWNNYPEPACWLPYSKPSDRRRKPLMRAARAALALFQASLNPAPEDQPGRDPAHQDLSYRIDDLPHVSFFVADTRVDRERDRTGHERMMPDSALTRLQDWAATLTRPGVLVVGQPLWLREGSRDTDLNPARFRDQYDAIWRAIHEAPHDILIVSGDVHHSRLIEIELDGNRRVFEYVSSPASHIPALIGGSQGRGDVDFLTAPPLRQIPGDPRLVNRPYLFGTNAPSSVGTLTFHPAHQGSVAVDAAFWDLDDDARAAEGVWANIGPGTLGMRPRFEGRCDRRSAFTLRPRS